MIVTYRYFPVRVFPRRPEAFLFAGAAQEDLMAEAKHRHYPKSQKTRQRILTSALTLMKNQGYQGATIRGICKKAGVSPASFYSYFKSKSDLLQDIYAESDRFFSTELVSLIENRPFLDQLRSYVQAYADLNLQTGIDMMRVLYNPENVWFSRERPMQKTLAAIVKNGQKEGVLPQTLSAQELVRNIFVILRGVCYDWCVYDGDYDLPEAMLRHVGYFLWGVSGQNFGG